MILTFLGIVFILFIGKFIWDTYVTGETDIQHKKNVQQDPEKMARMQNTVSRGEYLNFNYSPKRDAAIRFSSLAIIASKFGCNPNEAENHWLNETIKRMMHDGFTTQQAIEILNKSLLNVRQQKHDEAIQRVIDPDDTCASFTEEWIRKLIEALRAQPLEPLTDENEDEEYL